MHATVVGCHGAQGVSSRYLPSDLSRHLPAADAVSQCIPLSPSSPSYHPSYPPSPSFSDNCVIERTSQTRQQEAELRWFARAVDFFLAPCRHLPRSDLSSCLLLSLVSCLLLSPLVSSCLLLSPVSYLLSPLVLSCRFCRFGIKQHVSAAFRNYTRA